MFKSDCIKKKKKKKKLVMKNERQKFKTDPLTFSLFHFSPLTFNFIIDRKSVV